MKIKRKKELTGKTLNELYNISSELEKEIKKLVIEVKLGKHKNTSIARDKKREFALVKTLINIKKERDK